MRFIDGYHLIVPTVGKAYTAMNRAISTELSQVFAFRLNVGDA